MDTPNTTEQWQKFQKELLQFARNQVSDPHHAEDLVQEALTKALQNREQFKGNSAWQTWVYTILKNSIIDHLRAQRNINLSSFQNEQDEITDNDILDKLFDERGLWQHPNEIGQWRNPEQIYESSNFMQTLTHCLNALPAKQARVFIMREYLELESEEICGHCHITSSTYYTLMHRCRLQLQNCLNHNWFNPSPSSATP